MRVMRVMGVMRVMRVTVASAHITQILTQGGSDQTKTNSGLF